MTYKRLGAKIIQPKTKRKKSLSQKLDDVCPWWIPRVCVNIYVDGEILLYTMIATVFIIVITGIVSL